MLPGMPARRNEDNSAVSGRDLETLLTAFDDRSGNPRAGIFGPGSTNWKINRESALFLGAGRAALLQLAHPWVAAALAEHSTLLSDPIARFQNTFRVVFAMIFGTRDQALQSSRRLHALHSKIRGKLPEDVGRYAQDSRYAANEVAALRWVFATLVESAIIAYEYVLPPLTAAEHEQYYAESKTVAALFGIPPSALPQDWPGFAAYSEEMVRSDALGVSDGARAMARNLLEGAGSWIRPPRWYRALTALSIPVRFREEFGLGIEATDRRSVALALRWLPHVYRAMPHSLRFVGPYREAERRLAGRSLGITGRWSNRFWIGQPQMPRGES
jgi:uncharacterized protein (DUF2236 family)